MYLSLQELESHKVHFDVDIPPGQIEFDSHIGQTSTLHADGYAELVEHALEEVRVRGKLSVTMEAPCDRCLEAAAFPIERTFDLTYWPEQENSGQGEIAIDERGSEIGYYEGSGLELNDVLREVVLLALPMQWTCSESCKGICPNCGQNRNQIPCDCHARAEDGRWSKLKHFRVEIGPGN